ncbi:hypothetical protein LBMAG55_01080 [Verrucomicrobiota bacterium]|nr:hypothetical protein EMGBD4_03410 [Verrucomicrobiota bacterium]GDY16785.1 hypothetical protein LBMAG55_01080 [Verrucomicrobiota bacterium]
MPAEAPLIAARRSPRSWRGFLASLLVHIGLIASAAWFVVSRTTSLPRGPDPSVHTVAGGREAGSETPVRKAPPPAHPAVALRRIAVASPSSVSLPDLPAAQALGGLAASSAGQGPGGLSGGRGFGGGGGQGLGLGQGLAAGFVGKPVLGATIRAQKVAVYLDCSGSMKPYLERVDGEIRKQFPDADVFRFDGARVVALGDDIVHGRRFHGDAPKLHEGPTETVVASLTASGQRLQAKIREACEKGSLGAWVDWLLAEPYDALVVFSDFQDGVRIYEEGPKGNSHLIYSDSAYHRMNDRKALSYRWEKAWLEAFGQAEQRQGPRLYLFSIQTPPQDFLLKCVQASGGTAVDVGWLRSGRRGR